MSAPHAAERGARVLLIDGNDTRAGALTLLLDEEGLSHRRMTTGVSALAAVELEPPDLILLAEDVPGSNGTDLCRALKERIGSPSTPVLMLCSSRQSEIMNELFEAGAAGVLVQPFIELETASCIRTHLRLHALERAMQIQKSLEHELKLKSDAIENSLNAFDIIDEKGLFIYANRAYLRMWGYESQEEILGTSPATHCLDPTTPDRIEAAVRAKGEAILEFTAKRKDGSTFEVLMYTLVTQDEDGRPIFPTTSIDITERKRAESQLRELNLGLETMVTERTRELRVAKDKAESANHAKSEFLSNMSHEIRTPMNAILGFAEVLGELDGDPRRSRYLKAISTSGLALLNLINDVLDLSKIESGKMDLQLGATSIRTLFEEMQVIFNQKIVDKGLELHMEIESDVPSSLILDETRTRQVLINLIGNAIKFTDKGFIRLAAISRRGSSNHVSQVDLDLEVTDSGIGIPPDQQQRIFEAFLQRSGQNASKYGGTGLGLAIASRLTEMMGGMISVESEVGQGSTFRVSLRGIEVAATEAASVREDKRLSFQGIRFDPATILIADDIDYNRELLTVFLEPFGFRFVQAKNGREAVELARAHRPSIILLDMKMPEVDGFEALQILQDDPVLDAIPVLAVTASALKQDEEVIADLCDGYLRKPVSKTELVAAIMRFLPHRVEGDAVAKSDSVGRDAMASADALARELAAIPEERRARLVAEAEGAELSRLEHQLAELAVEYPALAAAMQPHVESFRFDLIVEMLTKDLSP